MAQVQDQPSVRSAIQACKTLSPLSEDEMRSVYGQCFMAFAERGETIWLAGSPTRMVAVVTTGFMKMTRPDPRGAEIEVELLGPGQCLGLRGVIEGLVYAFSAVAVTDSWYLKIPTRVFLEIYSANPDLKAHVHRSLAPARGKALDMMARVSSGRIDQRIAALLLILSESYGEPQLDGTRITIPLTRQNLAEMAGTTVETSIRVMSRFQKQGIVATSNQIITVLDSSALSNFFLC